MSDSITNLQQMMIDGGKRVFDIVPIALRNVIKEKQWKGRRDKNGDEFKSFESFVAHIRWQGLESSIDELLVYCRKFPDVAKLIKREVGAIVSHSEAGAKGGRGNKASDNVTGFRGNNPTYALRRLKRDRPDLAQKVIDGELSANAAAIKAGFRKKPTKLTHCPYCGHEL